MEKRRAYNVIAASWTATVFAVVGIIYAAGGKSAVIEQNSAEIIQLRRADELLQQRLEKHERDSIDTQNQIRALLEQILTNVTVKPH